MTIIDALIVTGALGGYTRWATRQNDTADGYDHRPIGTCRDCGAEDVRVQQIRPHILLDHENYCQSCAEEILA